MRHAFRALSLVSITASFAAASCSGETTDPPIRGLDTDASVQGPLDASTSDVTTTSDGATPDASVPDSATPDVVAPDAAVDAGDANTGADASVDAGDAQTDGDIDAGPGSVPATARAVLQDDLVAPGDLGLTGDGADDGTITATVVGPVDGLILVTTDMAGTSAGGQQWDTLSLSDPLPSIGTSFTLGSDTWVLGVFDGTTLLNDASAHISLGAGVHQLTLAASSSGFFTAGQHFRIYAHHTGGGWNAGPVFQW